MNDGSINQGRILRNLMRLMDATCGRSLYEVLPRGVQVWIPSQGVGVYPDLAVVAGEPLLHQGRSDQLLNPCLLFEIAAVDDAPIHNSLFRPCQTIPYLQAYVVVHQTRPRVEQFVRNGDRWDCTVQGDRTAVVELAITNARLPVMDIYDRVDFSLLV